MELYILRHAIAVDRGSKGYADDSKRPLTPDGRRKMKEIAAGMKAMELKIGLILSSPYVRARQTAEIVLAEYGKKSRLEFSDLLTPGGGQNELIEELAKRRAKEGSIMLVGHEPDLSALICLLLTGFEGGWINFKKGGLCKLTIGEIKAGPCATLEWMMAPGQLRRMS